MFKWFATAPAQQFAQEQADFILSQLRGSMDKRDAKFTAKAEKVLVRVDRNARDFRTRERLNFYKKARLANAFLWKLKDGGCPPEYAKQLTEWLTFRL
ncbi:hypothetical protein HHL11_02910 [Ramlibacter sp. G-1-2-2]|uniref:Uncharacterized protein n=1 Tax=Ramlibacter agri TaxID=2728837 RepID=A0A848GVP5_9BURK|nr:hypothetical protein [Ramlibacter agri]NML42685.1 hypothetical protein [Ramlibacter agri]